MARDYRYGHKTKKTTVRRTQEHETQDSVVTEKGQQTDLKPKSFWSGMNGSRKNKPADLAKPSLDVVSSDEASAETLNSASMRRLKQAHHKLMPERTPEMQKIIDKACQSSLPNTIRKEAEQREAQAKQAADLLALEQAKARALAIEKQHSRMGWGLWGSLTLLILLGVAWLLYAPFFLAFALEMQWIDEQARNRLDPAAAMRSQAVSTLTKDKQEPVKTSVPALAPLPAQEPEAADLQYSFYKELPKANIVTLAQPLPVRTRAPTYLQLASIVDDKEAQGERKRLAQKGYLVQMTAQVTKGKTVYVLRMGPYEDQRVINRLKVELQRLGVDAHEVSLVSVVKAAEPQPMPPPTNTINSTPANNAVVAPSRADAQQKATR